jgi:hypothetical protein
MDLKLSTDFRSCVDLGKWRDTFSRRCFLAAGLLLQQFLRFKLISSLPSRLLHFKVVGPGAHPDNVRPGFRLPFNGITALRYPGPRNSG